MAGNYYNTRSTITTECTGEEEMQFFVYVLVFFICNVHSTLSTLGPECNYMLAWLVANVSKLELSR